MLSNVIPTPSSEPKRKPFLKTTRVLPVCFSRVLSENQENENRQIKTVNFLKKTTSAVCYAENMGHCIFTQANFWFQSPLVSSCMTHFPERVWSVILWIVWVFSPSSFNRGGFNTCYREDKNTNFEIGFNKFNLNIVDKYQNNGWRYATNRSYRLQDNFTFVIHKH